MRLLWKIPKSNFAGRGISKKMAYYCIEISRRKGCITVRQGLPEGNIPAAKVYAALEFRRVGKLEMFYADTGWTNCKFYELIL